MNEVLVQKINQIVMLEDKLKAIKEIEAQIKEEKEELRQAMINANLKSWETPNGTKLTLVEDSPDEEIEVPKLDGERFIEENDALIEEYNNIVIKYEKKKKEYTTYKKEIKPGRKGYVRVTLPKSN